MILEPRKVFPVEFVDEDSEGTTPTSSVIPQKQVIL